MAASIEWFVFVLAGSILLYLLLIIAAKNSWKDDAIQYTTGRVEKACDSATAIISILIPATLGLATWLYEKLGPRWYMGLLAVSTVWFLIILLFTMYMRFNFTWSHEQKFTVGTGQNLELVYWLLTICYGLVVGFLLLAVPVFMIAFRAGPLEPQTVATQPRAPSGRSRRVASPAAPCAPPARAHVREKTKQK